MIGAGPEKFNGNGTVSQTPRSFATFWMAGLADFFNTFTFPDGLTF
jgi:hypothetical protein